MARYVYGLKNPSFRKYVRLCVSNGNPNAIVRKLGNAFTPFPYEVVCAFKSPYALELYYRMTELLEPLHLEADWYEASVVDLLSAWTTAVEYGPATIRALRRQKVRIREKDRSEPTVPTKVSSDPDLLASLLRQKELQTFRRQRRKSIKDKALCKVQDRWDE